MGDEHGRILLDWKNNLTGARFAFNGMNFFVDPADIDIASGQMADMVNCDVDYKYNASRRTGIKQLFPLNTHSMWSGDKYSYAVIENFIAKITFHPDSVEFSYVPISNPFSFPTEFKQMNDVVVVSDGVSMGIIDNMIYTPIGIKGHNLQESDITQWVKDNYPNDPSLLPSNMESNTFKLDTVAGKCLEFFNGRIFFAINNFVFCTNTFDSSTTDIRFEVVAGFGNPVTMITRVADGLFIGTTADAYFLSGTGYHYEGDKLTSGFTQQQVLKYGVVYNTSARVNATLVPDAHTDDTLVLAASPLGIFAFCNGGKTFNLSGQQISLPTASIGCALFKEQNHIYQYITCFNTGPECFQGTTTVLDENVMLDTIVVNTINLAHTRYTKYPFNSFCNIGNRYFGANVRGIFEFRGDLDWEGQSELESTIDAPILTPITDFEKMESKSCLDAYIHSRQTGDLELDVYVNESDMFAEGLVIHHDGLDGVHRRRVEIPFGMEGTNWQFRIRNVNGCDFTIFDLEIVAKTNQRVVSRVY